MPYVAIGSARGKAILVVVCMALLVIVTNNTILNVALPTIIRDLHPTGSEVEWIVDSYTIVFACLLLSGGALGDKFGRRRVILLGLALFALFSTLASMATSPEMLTVMRGLMGIAGALIFPTTLSIITNTYEGPERARAIGIWAGVVGVAVALGPIGGGLILEHFWWGAVFLVNVPICVAAIALGAFAVPESKDPRNRPLDPPGIVLSMVGMFGVIYAIIEVPAEGWGSATVLGSLALGVLFLLAFGWWELRSRHPMLDVRVFENPRFSAASATITITAFSLYGAVFLLTQYFQLVLGYSPLKAGLMSLPSAVGIMLTSPNAPKMVARWGTKRTVVFGLALVAVALLLFASDTLMSSYVIGSLVRAVFGLGLGISTAPATSSIMSALPPSRAGVGSALNDATRQTGGAFGVAVLGTVFLFAYRDYVDRAVGLGHSAKSALSDSIASAVHAASRASADDATRIVHLAQQGFIHAMRLTFPITSLVVVCAAVVAWRFLPARIDHDVADETPVFEAAGVGADVVSAPEQEPEDSLS